MKLTTLNKKLESIENPAIQWKPRKQVFERRNLAFCPIKMHATSYTWYDLFKVINGVNVLNDFRYSTNTGRHIRLMRALLQQLGIKYVSIEAPKGLQDLERAKNRELFLHAKSVVANKYARIKTRPHNRIELLKKLGIKVTIKEVKAAIARAEMNRLSYLQEQRRKANERKTRKVVLENIVKELQLIANMEGAANIRDYAQSKGISLQYSEVRSIEQQLRSE